MAGVEVGYSTIIMGDGALQVGTGPVRTGVTAIFPRGKAGGDTVFANAVAAYETLDDETKDRIDGLTADALRDGVKIDQDQQRAAYTLALMDREEVERIRTERARWIMANDAAIAAGVPPSVISHLLEAGLLTCDELWPRDILKSGPIEKTSIDALMVRLAAVIAV